MGTPENHLLFAGKPDLRWVFAHGGFGIWVSLGIEFYCSISQKNWVFRANMELILGNCIRIETKTVQIKQGRD